VLPRGAQGSPCAACCLCGLGGGGSRPPPSVREHGLALALAHRAAQGVEVLPPGPPRSACYGPGGGGTSPWASSGYKCGVCVLVLWGGWRWPPPRGLARRAAVLEGSNPPVCGCCFGLGGGGLCAPPPCAGALRVAVAPLSCWPAWLYPAGARLARWGGGRLRPPAPLWLAGAWVGEVCFRLRELSVSGSPRCRACGPSQGIVGGCRLVFQPARLPAVPTTPVGTGGGGSVGARRETGNQVGHGLTQSLRRL